MWVIAGDGIRSRSNEVPSCFILSEYLPMKLKIIGKKFRRWWLRNSSRVHLERWNKDFAKLVKKDEYVLDAGAGRAPYRHLFSLAHYETADFEMVDKKYHPSTYVCDLKSIPVEDERFHYIVFNQVMEHLPDPLTVLREFRRILKPEGKLICTCPLFYAEHEKPFDFYRYTQFGHRYLFDQAELEIESLDWMEGYFGTIGYQMESVYKDIPLNPAKFPMGIPGYIAVPILVAVKYASFILAGLFYRLDIRFRYTASGMPKNYVVIARKIVTHDAEVLTNETVAPP